MPKTPELRTPSNAGGPGAAAIKSERSRKRMATSPLMRVDSTAHAPTIPLAHIRRPLMRQAASFMQNFMTRTEVRGLEHIPMTGPVLVLPNHVSNLDGPLILANMPRPVEMVGPGDFKMVTLKDWLMRFYGVSLIRRGEPDRAGMKLITSYLRAGRAMLMFPGGGMWEKRLSQVKPGAAYLSQATQAPILPVALGGTYLKSEAAFQFGFPQLSVTFGPLMPPVPPSADRRSRDADLEAASREIIARIYDLLPDADKALYDRWERESYELCVEFGRYPDGTPVRYDGPPIPLMGALGEFIIKPNLFRPMWQNAMLHVESFMAFDRFHPAIEVKMAARQLFETLSGGTFQNYLPYRLGDDVAAAALEDLQTMRRLADWALAHNAEMRLVPVAHDPEADA